jgi:hypothetical protein
MSSKKKEKKVNDRVEKAVHFFVSCQPNPDTRLSIPAAIRAKGFGCQGHGLNCCPAGAPQVPKKVKLKTLL